MYTALSYDSSHGLSLALLIISGKMDSDFVITPNFVINCREGLEYEAVSANEAYLRPGLCLIPGHTPR